MRTITVYTTPACRQCNMTKKWMDDRGIPYTVVDATADEQTGDAIRAIAAGDGIEGKVTMPYVQVSTGDPETDLHWFGFIPANLEKYTLEKAAA